MKTTILAGIALALSLVSSAALASPKPGCCDASKCKTVCCKVACCDAPCCPPSKGAAVKKTIKTKVAKTSHKGSGCCSMPCCNGGACCSSTACCATK